MAVCSLFNKMLLLTDLIPVHLLYCGQTVMIGCNHTSFEWTRAVRHIYGIIRHMQDLYTNINVADQFFTPMCFESKKWVSMLVPCVLELYLELRRFMSMGKCWNT